MLGDESIVKTKVFTQTFCIIKNFAVKRDIVFITHLHKSEKNVSVVVVVAKIRKLTFSWQLYLRGGGAMTVVLAEIE